MPTKAGMCRNCYFSTGANSGLSARPRGILITLHLAGKCRLHRKYKQDSLQNTLFEQLFLLTFRLLYYDLPYIIFFIIMSANS